MNSASKHAVVAILVISIAGCAEKQTKIVQPVQAQAPSIDTGKAGAMYPPPLTEAPAQPALPAPTTTQVVTDAQPAPAPEPPPAEVKKTTTHKAKPSAAKPAASTDAPASNQAAAPPTQPETASVDIASGEPSGSSPIGQLSAGDTAGRTETRKETVDLIAGTESGLNGIKRPLNAQEQETANQIKSFLSKAKLALTNDDLDGAFTLATKAKVLLDELVKT